VSAKTNNGRKPHALLVVENCSVPADRRVWNQARAAVAGGYDVTVISPVGIKAGDVLRQETREGVDIRRFPMPFGGPRKIDFLFEYGWAVLICHWLALKVWRRNRIDVIHVANPPDMFFGLKWLFGRKGATFVFDQHDLGPETYQSKFEEERADLFSRLLGWLEQRSYRAADAVIVTNESYRERAVGRGRMADDEVFTVRNSPDLNLFKPRPPVPELKAGFDHMVLFVGTMGHQDGVHILLDAADYVRTTLGRQDVLFVMVGTGDAWDRLQEQHSSLGLGDGVRFTGFISDDDMLDYMATADVGAAPDIESPLNNISTMIKTMDYMAMGVPVVSFDLTESRVSAGEAAVYATEHSGESFGEAILSLIDNPELRTKMGEIGQDRISGPLSWENSAKQLLAAYRRARGLDPVTADLPPERIG
jgi:glycosyltransferase involved in cell wall biosynthesis